MNKKGFTLIELLAVIALLGVILIIAVPSVGKISSNIKAKELENKKDLIETSAVLYVQDNNIDYQSTSITFNVLLSSEYLKPDINNGGTCTNQYGCMINPVDNSIMDDTNYQITLSKNGNVLIATVSEK